MKLKFNAVARLLQTANPPNHTFDPDAWKKSAHPPKFNPKDKVIVLDRGTKFQGVVEHGPYGKGMYEVRVMIKGIPTIWARQEDDIQKA